jgi:hypothetical protein
VISPEAVVRRECGGGGKRECRGGGGGVGVGGFGKRHYRVWCSKMNGNGNLVQKLKY